MTITGVTAGKFYPLHLGHKYMLTEAVNKVDKLYILVVQESGEWPIGAIRKEWVKELFPQAKVILCENLPGQENDSVAWAKYAKDLAHAADSEFKGSFDKVFGSEEYTKSWAKELGAEAFVIDLLRAAVPISGTRLREDPHERWRYLTDPAREFYCKRLCIVGGESTGKSTMARNIGWTLGVQHTPEVGRWYVEEFGDSIGDGCIWRTIVSTQLEIEDHLARASQGMVVCDTDLLTTSVWFERWVGHTDSPMYNRIVNKWADSSANRFNHRPYHRYVLLDHSVPWIDDGTRSEGEHRQWFTDRFVELFNHFGIEYLHVKDEDYKARELQVMEYFLS